MLVHYVINFHTVTLGQMEATWATYAYEICFVLLIFPFSFVSVLRWTDKQTESRGKNINGNFVLRISLHTHNFFPCYCCCSALWFLIADLLIINNKQELSTRRAWYVFNACHFISLKRITAYRLVIVCVCASTRLYIRIWYVWCVQSNDLGSSESFSFSHLLVRSLFALTAKTATEISK